MDLISVFRRTSARQPDRPFASDSKTTVSYGEADARTDAIGVALCAARDRRWRATRAMCSGLSRSATDHHRGLEGGRPARSHRPADL